jgi:Mg/Co/Ni transporter MgtE
MIEVISWEFSTGLIVGFVIGTFIMYVCFLMYMEYLFQDMR